MSFIDASKKDSGPEALRKARRIGRSFRLPVQTAAITILQMWHPRIEADPAHRWLRELVLATRRDRTRWLANARRGMRKQPGVFATRSGGAARHGDLCQGQCARKARKALCEMALIA